ncbi:MAG: hypothetical protein JNK48_12385 [Bryobacterales bacterium]|nr:hypothetical protein [Bryobacterales bacterium]
MTRRLVFGLILAAAVATPGGFPNPFKKSKDASASKSVGAESKAADKVEPIKLEMKQGYEGQYIGGTVAAIPQFTNGKLDLSEKGKIAFHFGTHSWSVPSNKVATIEVADRKQVRLLKVPGLMKDKRVFTIAFDNERGQRQSLIIEMNVETALAALPALEERSGKFASVEGAQNPDGWWGDRYWRTAHNSQVWDEASGANKNTVAQAKD